MKDTRIPGLFFEIVLEHCLLICNRLPRTLYARPVSSATAAATTGAAQGGVGPGAEVVSRSVASGRICDSDYVIEAGESLSLAADPAAMIVLFDDLVSRPIDIIYKAQGVRNLPLQRDALGILISSGRLHSLRSMSREGLEERGIPSARLSAVYMPLVG